MLVLIVKENFKIPTIKFSANFYYIASSKPDCKIQRKKIDSVKPQQQIIKLRLKSFILKDIKVMFKTNFIIPMSMN